MRRVKCEPRSDWAKRVLPLMPYANTGAGYWNESAYWTLSEREFIDLKSATLYCYRLLMQTLDKVVFNDETKQRLVDLLHREWAGVPEVLREGFINLLLADWQKFRRQSVLRKVHTYQTPVLFGRMDFVFDHRGKPRMLEFNSDTPVTMIECGPATQQWWLDLPPDRQVGLHPELFRTDLLIDAFHRFAQAGHGQGGRTALFTCEQPTAESALEYQSQMLFLAELAGRAGMRTAYRSIDAFQFDDAGRLHCDGLDVDSVFKLYPTEWLLHDLAGWEGTSLALLHGVFGQQQFFNHPSAVLLGGKWLLAFAWELYPDACLALGIPRTWFSREAFQRWAKATAYPADAKVVAKTLYGCVGTGVEILEPHQETTLQGPLVWQEYIECPVHDGFRHTVGSWMLDGHFGGIGMREQQTSIIDNYCLATPLLVEQSN